MMTILLAGLLVTVLSGAPPINSQRGTYTVYGAGTSSCGTWTSDRGTIMRDVLLMWALGFVSGSGFSGNRELRLTDSKGIETWIDRRCARDPLLPLSDAVQELVIELSKQP
jgi:hypothetical protein